MSRIYIVTHRPDGAVARYVRANSLNGAIRAYATECYEASAATTEQVFQAMKAGAFEVLDAVAPEQIDIRAAAFASADILEDANDPGPVPPAAMATRASLPADGTVYMLANQKQRA
jgi:hypothetical protein